VVFILSKLFNMFIKTGHIPVSFGASYTVPIPQCNVKSCLSVDNFRGIFISPVISKLFEMAVLDRYSDYFKTSDHQFGFKKHLAIYNVRSVRSGLDGLSCEHIKFSHPIVVFILSKLFNMFIKTGHIPVSFGASYTVPIPKCNVKSCLSVDNFRGISISPVISKLFEMAVLDRYSDYFKTSDHQFGLKKHLAIYNVRSVIEK